MPFVRYLELSGEVLGHAVGHHSCAASVVVAAQGGIVGGAFGVVEQGDAVGACCCIVGCEAASCEPGQGAEDGEQGESGLAEGVCTPEENKMLDYFKSVHSKKSRLGVVNLENCSASGKQHFKRNCTLVW